VLAPPSSRTTSQCARNESTDDGPSRLAGGLRGAVEISRRAANPGGTILHENFNGREGPVQIVEHLHFHTDADGNVTVGRTFERHVGC
jgi:hypothetical protein